MGGFFIRKLMGGTGTMVHLHKLYPMLMHETGAQYTAGEFGGGEWKKALVHSR